jgi:predicted ATP-binding protein involved in virulence
VLRPLASGDWEAHTPTEQTKGLESAAALLEVMGVDPIPNVDEARWLEAYKQKIEQGTHTDAAGQGLRAKLEAVYGPEGPPLRDADSLARLLRVKKAQS